jgi:hypothetical protein
MHQPFNPSTRHDEFKSNAMIVKPEFLEHWKTQRLVEITKDESAPLCVIRLWGHCQTSRKWEFPDMTAETLAAICRWAKRKPACHVALVKSGFVDRLKKGFAAHDWHTVNGQLIQKWDSGKKGGRPAKPRTESEPAETGRLQPDTRTETDKTRQDGLDQNSTHNVNLVKPAPETDLTKLTLAKVSLERVAREIAEGKRWSYDNCKVNPGEISAPSLQKVLRPYVGKLTENSVHECWQEAVTRAHKAKVDDLVKQTIVGYCVTCFKEQLQRHKKR